MASGRERLGVSAETDSNESRSRVATGFTTTHWSVVLSAGRTPSPQSLVALEKLCQTYWYPLYAYARHRGHQACDAQDAVQGFFAELIEHRGLKRVERGHGRFRTYLLSAFRHFLANDWDRARAQKRGGRAVILSLEAMGPENLYAQELADEPDPEKLYERAWATTVLQKVQNRLRGECVAQGKTDRFAALEPFLSGERGDQTYAQIGAQLNLAEGSVKAEVHRLRKRYRALLRLELAHTVASAEEISDELRALMTAVSG
jgi:RNA polymerase sigma factor (sigma-70 family)